MISTLTKNQEAQIIWLVSSLVHLKYGYRVVYGYAIQIDHYGFCVVDNSWMRVAQSKDVGKLTIWDTRQKITVYSMQKSPSPLAVSQILECIDKMKDMLTQGPCQAPIVPTPPAAKEKGIFDKLVSRVKLF